MVVLGLSSRAGSRKATVWWLWRAAEMRRRYTIIAVFGGCGCGSHLDFGFIGILFHASGSPCSVITRLVPVSPGEGWRLGAGTAFGAAVVCSSPFSLFILVCRTCRCGVCGPGSEILIRIAKVFNQCTCAGFFFFFLLCCPCRDRSLRGVVAL